MSDETPTTTFERLGPLVKDILLAYSKAHSSVMDKHEPPAFDMLIAICISLRAMTRGYPISESGLDADGIDRVNRYSDLIELKRVAHAKAAKAQA